MSHAPDWVKLDEDEKRKLLHGGARRTGVHDFRRKVLHWRACLRCGLMNLKNDESRRAAKRPCVWEE